jgi:hypothetical protein
MSKKSIKKLKKAHKFYDLNVEGMAAGNNQMAIKAFLTILSEENPPRVVKKATAIALGENIEEAQDKAVAAVIERLVD